MKNKFNQLLFLLFLFFTSQTYSSPINKINFIGLNNASESFLLSVIPFDTGMDFSSNDSNKIIEALFETELFSDISVANTENILDITLVENPIIKYFDVELDSGSGFSSWVKNEKMLLTSDILEDEVNTYKLLLGNPFTTRNLDAFIASIESKYIESGYYNVEINPVIDIDLQNRVGVELYIKQGERAKIESFQISGSSKISEKELIKLFEIGEADMAIVNYFTKKDLFTDTEFRTGIDLMTNAYFDKGYLDFKINDVKTQLDQNKEKISIEIKISEGVQYQLGKISFNQETNILSENDLNSALTINEGDIFNRNKVIQDIQTLTDLFADKGYAFVEINPITSELINVVDIEFEISLNKKVYINRINILGNTRTQDDVIRREIGVSEGGLYSRSMLRKSLLKLRRLGYFSDVQISTSEVKDMPDKIDITFNVEETQTGSVSFSVSHSNNYGISFGAGIQEKNIFGSGNTLNAKLQISESYNKVSFYFMNPNFNDKGHSVSIGAFKSEINDDDIATNSYSINSTGLTLGYGVPLSDDTRINTDFEFSKNEVICSSLFSGSGYESAQCASKNKDEFKANVSWSQNTLNDFMYPTDGVNNSLSAGISLPLGDYRYFDLNADHKSYRPVSDTLTLKLTGNLNLSKGYNNKELPFYKRNFGGGSGSVRGFGNKTLGPLYPNGKAKGGEIAILGSANLISPAIFFDDNDKMRMSVFIDAGNIYEKSSNIKLGEIRMSAGLGFAYLSPIGSIGAFISTPILKKDGDTIEDFGFSLGTGF